MARNIIPSGITQHLVTDDDTPGLTTMADAVNFLAAEQHQTNENTKSLARELGYEGALTIGALEDEIRFYQRRTVETCIELGKRLLLLKELTPHGEFKQRVEILGFAYRTASRFMQASIKVSKSANLALLAKRTDSTAKFLELLVLDDDEAGMLEQGESVRGIKLDDVDTMSYSELKKALRESRETMKAKDDMIARKNQKIDELDEKLTKKPIEDTKLIPAMPGEAELITLQDVGRAILTRMQTELRRAIVELNAAHSSGMPKTANLAVAQTMGLIITAGYEIAEDWRIQPILNADTAADDPAKAEAEEYIKWHVAEFGHAPGAQPKDSTQE